MNEQGLLFGWLEDLPEDNQATAGSIISSPSTLTGDRGEHYFDFMCGENGISILKYNCSNPKIDRVIETRSGEFKKIHIKTSNYKYHKRNGYGFGFLLFRHNKKHKTHADYFVCIGLWGNERHVWWLPWDLHKDKTLLFLKCKSLRQYKKIPDDFLTEPRE